MNAFREVALAPVTRQQIARFAGAVRDFHPLHVDEEFAKASGWPSVIAHGPLTLALAIDAIVAQLGVDALERVEARMVAPVLPGESLAVVPTESGFDVRTQSGTVVLTANTKVVV